MHLNGVQDLSLFAKVIGSRREKNLIILIGRYSIYTLIYITIRSDASNIVRRRRGEESMQCDDVIVMTLTRGRQYNIIYIYTVYYVLRLYCVISKVTIHLQNVSSLYKL